MERHLPLTIVGLLNDLMVSLGRGRSATLGLLTLAFEDAELEVVSAGHLPTLLRHADGSREFIGEASGPPLGAFASAAYGAATFPFPAGSSLLLYTDGLVERRGASIELGMQRLSAALRPGARANVPLADAVFERLPDERLEDDVACLAVESLMLSDTFDFELEAVPAVLSPLRRAISRWLGELGATATERFDLTLACSEAAANAIEHAHGPISSNFEVTCRYRGSEAKVTIRDRGSWREQGGRDRDRGRGLLLMLELTDDLAVESDAGGTRVVLTKTLTRARHP
jgi:anti-sigma regulatory factor (Ser/Thr protein kinase)